MATSLSLPKQLDSSALEGVLQYLLEILQEERLSSMNKLAAFSVLHKLIKDDCDQSIKRMCLKADLLTSVLLALDTGLSPKCDPADGVYVSVTMEILWQLSRMNIGSIQPLISDSVIRRLLTFLNLEGSFFRYPAGLTNQLTDLSENKHLIGVITPSPMTSDRLMYIERHSRGQFQKLSKWPDMFHMCSLFDTSTEEDVNIAQSLVERNLAWPGTGPGSSKTEQETWRDIVVTQVLDGGLFWAHLGEESILAAAQIQKNLNQCSPGLERKEVAKTGDSVVVEGPVLGTKCFIRAKVLGGSRETDEMEVFAVDHGFLLTVPGSQVFTLPDHVSLAISPPVASLCCLSGISAPPFDVCLAANAAAVLANICQQSVPAGEICWKLGGLAILERLLCCCPDKDVNKAVIGLVNNLACNPRLGTPIVESTLVHTLLGVLNRVIEGELDRPLAKACISTLATLLWKHKELRQQFYENQGVDLVLRLVSRVGRSSPLYRACTQLLKNFVGIALPVSERKSSNLSPSPQQQRDSGGKLVRETEPVRQASDRPRQQSDQEASEAYQCITSRGKDNKSDPVESTLDSRHLIHMSGSGDSESCDRDTDTEALFQSKAGLLNTSSVAMDTAESHLVTSSGNYYVLGSKVKFTDDVLHELRPNAEVTKISATSIAQNVCGMLNTGQGGTLYFGIGKDSMVFGLEMSRDEKDQFRLGVDRLMTRKVCPTLLHFQYHCEAVPVVQSCARPDGAAEREIVPDCYVIEVSIKASKGVIYTMLDSGACYYRFGHETSAITRMELRRLIVVSEEAQYADKIHRLRRVKQDLLSKS